VCLDRSISLPLYSRIAADVVAGLTHLHRNRVLHLDLRPHNVMLVSLAARDKLLRVCGDCELMTRTCARDVVRKWPN
jgi:hypothetical protein